VVHRDNPDLIDRSIRHLEKLTPNYCTNALIRDEFTQIIDSKLQILTQYIGTLSTEVKRLRTESKAMARLALDKPYLLSPNEESSYGADCSAENYVKASGKVQAELSLLAKSITLLEKPYDFLLSICSVSKNAAYTYGLSKAQHRLLILSFIPTNSVIYKDLMLLRSLNDIFYFASINSSLMKTKSELEYALDTWKLDFSSHSSLNASLTQLRTALADLTGKDYADIDPLVCTSPCIEEYCGKGCPRTWCVI
jgi:hypothetical protein